MKEQKTLSEVDDLRYRLKEQKNYITKLQTSSL